MRDLIFLAKQLVIPFGGLLVWLAMSRIDPANGQRNRLLRVVFLIHLVLASVGLLLILGAAALRDARIFVLVSQSLLYVGLASYLASAVVIRRTRWK